MYTIIKLLSGKFHCQGRIQDGTERWEEDTLDAAIKSMKLHAKVLNGQKGLKRKSITFLQEAPVTETKLVPWRAV